MIFSFRFRVSGHIHCLGFSCRDVLVDFTFQVVIVNLFNCLDQFLHILAIFVTWGSKNRVVRVGGG